VNPEIPPEKPPRRRRWSIEMVAMVLLGVLICAPMFDLILLGFRCTFFFNGTVCARNWGFREWLDSTIPVLVAIIMRNSGRPPPADE
jgi:hypothetical protein